MTGLQVEEQNGIARLTLQRPPFNVLDIPLMRALATTARQLAGRPLVNRPRAMVLESGVQHQFCHGIDPQALLGTGVEGRKAVFLALADMVEALWFSYIPIIVNVNGPALAGGAVLAAVADFGIVCTRTAKICFSEVKVGLPLPFFIQRLIERRVAPSAWNEIMLLGRNIDAVEAQRIGFAQSTYDSESERDELLASIAGRIFRVAPAVLSETLRQSRERDLGLIPAFRCDMGRFADFLTDDYVGKGLAAVVRGESPKF